MSDLERKDAAIPDLRQMTQARVLLGRFGAGLPTRAAQTFLLDHARARQAVWSEWDRAALRDELADWPGGAIAVESCAADRGVYVRRPDLGRMLSSDSAQRLADVPRSYDVVVVVGDGLSASAVAINAAPVVRALRTRLVARSLALAPLILATQARVALADAIGDVLQARIAIMLIGERPGLTASDSLGIYVTYAPKPGTPDARRNCISNIREGGLSADSAAAATDALLADMLAQGVSGVALIRGRGQTQLPIPAGATPSDGD